MAKMTSTRPDRFGGGALPPAFGGATAPAATAPAAVEPSLTPVPEPTPVVEEVVAAPTAVEEAPEPKATPEPTKKTPASRSKRVVESTNSEVRRKYVEWDQSIEDEFQDGCDDWYGDRTRRERKRRLGRRPSDNAMVIALMRLGLEAIANDPKANDRLEELLPVDARRRRKA